MGNRIAPLVLVLAAGPAPAQLVVPGGYAAREAPSYTQVPFGRNGSVRLQQVYEGFLFPKGTLVLRGLALRGDEAAAAPAKTGVDLEILLGGGHPGVTALAAGFAANRPPGLATAFRRRAVSLPALAPGVGPMPFTLDLPFDGPLGYDPAGGALLVEIVVHDQPGSGHAADATYLATSAQEDFGPPGCRGSGGLVPAAVSATVNVQWGQKATLELQRLPPGAPCLIGLGVQTAGSWGVLTLPADLGPYGAPGCPLSLGLLHLAAAVADPGGRAPFAFALPPDPRLLGGWIACQGLVVDPPANPLGIATSAGHRVQVCGPEAVGRVYQFDLGAATGLAQVGVAAVTRFATP